MTRLGDFLKELRGSLSTVDVEREIGIPRITISRYERGENVPSPEKLKQLAALYEYPYEKLRLLYYDDLLSNPEDLAIIREWANNKFFSPFEIEIIEAIRKLPKEKQETLKERVLSLLHEETQ